MRSTSLHGEEEHREHRVSLQRHRLPRECVAYIQPCRYDAWLWLPPQDPAAKPPPNRRPLWLPLHCAAARQEASLRFVPRQPNPQKKEQHQENYHSSLLASFSPYCSLIKGTKTVQVMLARREMHTVGGPLLGRVRRQSRVVVGFLDQVLGTGSLVINPHQQVDGRFHVRHKNSIDVLRGSKQLILRFGSLVLFQVAQSDEPIGLPPTFGLILELALFIGIRLRRGPPVGLF